MAWLLASQNQSAKQALERAFGELIRAAIESMAVIDQQAFESVGCNCCSNSGSGEDTCRRVSTVALLQVGQR